MRSNNTKINKIEKFAELLGEVFKFEAKMKANFLCNFLYNSMMPQLSGQLALQHFSFVPSVVVFATMNC